MSVYFNGQELTTPTTASAVNDDALLNTNISGGNNVVYLGKSLDGEPNKVLTFGSPEQAKAILVDGDLLTAVIKAFNPSTETPAPSVVYGVRVDPAVQASLELLNSSSVVVVTLKSVGYRTVFNQIKAKIEAGSSAGKKLTVNYLDKTYIGDNLAEDVFTIDSTFGTATVTVGVNALTLDWVSGGDPFQLVLTYVDYPTIGDLVTRINQEAGFTAVVLGDNFGRASDETLDGLAAADISSSVKTVTGNIKALVDWANTQTEGLITATRTPNVGFGPVNIAYTYFTGGTTGIVTNTQYSNALSKLQFTDVQWVTPLTASASVHAMVDAHVFYCSQVLRRERRSICGMALGTSDADGIAAAALINSHRTSLMHIGHYDYNLVGALTLYPSYMTAAVIAAAFAGVSPGTPMTNKSLTLRGLERDLLLPTDTDPLIKGGVLCMEHTDDGLFKVVQSITTWLTDDKFNKVEQSCGFALDFTTKTSRKALDILRGQKANPILLGRAISITETTLKGLAEAEPNGPAVLAGDETSPPFKDITATIVGDVTRVQFQCSPVIPNNYVLVTVYAVPFTGTATAA